MLLIIVSVAGCSRSYWRQNADNEVYALIPEKMTDPRWDLPRIDITPDPRSRLFDVYPPDKGPLPPDDPAAHEYMHRVNGIRQSKSWHKFGTALSIENPHWLEPFGLAPSADGTMAAPLDGDAILPPPPAEAALLKDGLKDGEIIQTAAVQSAAESETSDGYPADDGAGHAAIDGAGVQRYGIDNMKLQQALELSYINSREYQDQIENLYLQALDLTFDRFQFQVRYLGIGGRKPTADGTFQSIPQGQNSITTNKRFGISRLLPAGGQMAVELANNTVWLFAGPNQTNTASTLSYSLVQPLLLGAGRKVVLEGLTQGERNTLYATRDLARFRKTFFSGVVGNFLGILQQTQVVANQQNNIRQLEKQVELLRAVTSQTPETTSADLPALPPALQIPAALVERLTYNAETKRLQWQGELSEDQERQLRELRDTTNAADFRIAVNEIVATLRTETVTLPVAQLETRLAGARNALSKSQVDLLDSLDQFKIQLGLPPDFHLTLDESLLKQFTLIDAPFFDLERQITDFVYVVSELNPADPDLTGLRTVAAGLKQLQLDVREYGLNVIDSDRELVDENMSERLARLSTEAARDLVRRNVKQDRRFYFSLQQDYAEIERQLDKVINKLSQNDVNLDDRKLAFTTLSGERERLLKVVQGLQPVQAGARVELIRLRQFQLGREESVALGLDNRLDLKNARAQVMDTRRRQEVAANRLESVLDIVAEGDVRTRPLAGNRGENPFDFRGRRSSFRIGARFTAPLDQISERNDYRVALINYQRSRRDYMKAEDGVKFSIRQSWRQLQLLRENFETARQALRLSATQLDQTVEEVTAPPRNVQGVQQQIGASTSGQQGLNLLRALEDLLRTQNSLIQIWVNYERSRINIHRDMGMMDIDPRGVWTDEFYQQSPPSNPPESNDTSKQFEEPVVLRVPNDRRQVRDRRGNDGAQQPIALGGRKRGRLGRGVRTADVQFALPRKIERDEESFPTRVAGGDLLGRVPSDSALQVGQDESIRPSGHRSR
jgi:outer membrane protein TolC